MGVQQAIGGTVAWHCEFDAAPSKILAHHWPEVPNLGDITTADWSQVEPVDVITGGFPCQDVSHAGRRQGLIRDGEGRTRSGLWGQMLRTIDTLRPALVVAENVRGLLSAQADSDVEPCPWCMGDGAADHPMRALGAVLADLADIGYDAAWGGLRAADVGAPHGRFRGFSLPRPAADTEHDGRHGPSPGRSARQGAAVRRARGPQGPPADPPPLTPLPTPTAHPAVNGGSQHPDKRRDGGHGPTLADEIEHLLPTPTAADAKASGGDPNTSNVTLTDATVRGRRLMLPSAAQLLPTPSVADVEGGRKARSGGRSDEPLLNGLAAEQRFGDYASAITRWEQALGRPAPAPTEPTGRGGAHRLSPVFVEWMMGLPAGHVTDVPGLTRNAQLKALGNGVVPQQAAEAVRYLTSAVL